MSPLGLGGITTPSPLQPLMIPSRPGLTSVSDTVSDTGRPPGPRAQTRLAAAPPKVPQPLVGLVDVASLPARLLGDVCTAVWEFTTLQVTETVVEQCLRQCGRDGWRRVSEDWLAS